MTPELSHALTVLVWVGVAVVAFGVFALIVTVRLIIRKGGESDREYKETRARITRERGPKKTNGRTA